jgi:hypothetical protein
VDEGLEPERRDGGADGADVVERVLAREHHPVDAEPFHHLRAEASCTVICVEPWISKPG